MSARKLINQPHKVAEEERYCHSLEDVTKILLKYVQTPKVVIVRSFFLRTGSVICCGMICVVRITSVKTARPKDVACTMNSSMTMCTTITMVNKVRRAPPISLVFCGLAWKVRRRNRSGVVSRCIDSSSAILKLLGSVNRRRRMKRAYTFGCGISWSCGIRRNIVQRQ